MTVVDPDDLRTVLAELGRTSTASSSTIAAADRLRASLEPTLLDELPPALSDPEAPAPGRLHRGAGETERAAALAAMPKTGTQRRRVLEAFVFAPSGLTDHELAGRTGLYLYSAAPRRTELVHGGWLRDSGRRRPTPSGTPAVVWVLTDDALRRLASQLPTEEGPRV